MPFLGKNPTSGFSTIVKDDLTPDGSTTAFTLSKQVASANDIAVFVGNVRQEPTDAYSVSGTTLTMTAAPASGLNFYVLHIAGTVESSVIPADGTISTAKTNFGAETGALNLPKGTTAQRPTPSAGMIRHNTTDNAIETYDGTIWKVVGDQFGAFDVEYIVVAGGGGGGGGSNGGEGGGGGAGGYRSSVSGENSGGGTSAESVLVGQTHKGTTLNITVGSGGAGAVGSTGKGANGTNSSIIGGSISITSTGGGGGGSRNGGYMLGSDGGSGGGNGQRDNVIGTSSGTAGQGYGGGDSSVSGGNGSQGGGGGGGAAGAGANSVSANGGAGGAAITTSITGSSISLAGGGGGSGVTSANGGGGGAGNGNTAAGVTGNSATDGTGSGGGGAGGAGGDGGDGVVYLRLPTSAYTGTFTGSPTVTTSGNNTILKFTGNGTYTI
jgi:hypothetical protein